MWRYQLLLKILFFKNFLWQYSFDFFVHFLLLTSDFPTREERLVKCHGPCSYGNVRGNLTSQLIFLSIFRSFTANKIYNFKYSMLNKCYLGSSLHDSWSNTELLQLINSESMLLLVTEKENNTQIFKGLMEYPDIRGGRAEKLKI